MPATASDVARATRAATTDVQSDSAVLTRQPGARDGMAAPRRGYWDSAADAATVNAAAFALIGTERRRFGVRVGDVLEPTGGFDCSTTTPAVTLVDAVMAVNAALLVSRLQIDDAAGVTVLEVFG
jgi:hypothetical protein